MAEIRTLTDQNWQQELGRGAALILMSAGDVRGDCRTQFKKSAAESQTALIFAEATPATNPQIADLLGYKDKPILAGWLDGEIVVRRLRPWGADVVLSIDLLEQKLKEQTPIMSDNNTADLMNNAANVIPVGQPVHVTDGDFQQMVVDYSHEKAVLVDFWAEWCGPCRMVAPILDKLAAEYGDQIRIAKVDTDANPGLGQAFRIMSIPTIMIFKKGHLIFSQPGALPEVAFRQLIDQAVALDVEKAIAESEARQATQD
jgi:thioredoxin